MEAWGRREEEDEEDQEGQAKPEGARAEKLARDYLRPRSLNLSDLNDRDEILTPDETKKQRGFAAASISLVPQEMNPPNFNSALIAEVLGGRDAL